MRALEHGAHSHGEFLAAGTARLQVRTGRLAFDLIDLLRFFAMRAIGPAAALKVLPGYGFVTVDGVGQVERMAGDSL
jgi:hypothetical protein